MKHLILCLTLFPAASSALQARVTVRTNIADVFVGLNAQQLGALTLNVEADDFSTASPSNPIYIVAQLDHNAVLCQTLVGPDDPAPLYIPMRLEGGLDTDRIAAAPNTAAVVRWIAGEDQVWIRIQSSSSTWVQTLSGLIPPDPTRPVTMTLGTSARVADQNAVSSAEDPEQFNANLPYATRAPGAAVNPELATSTLFCVDLSGSNLEAVPQPETLSVMNWDLTALVGSRHVRTAPHRSQIDRGTPWAVTFSNDTRIGRGFAVSDCNFPVTPNFARTVGAGAVDVSANVNTNCPLGFHTESYLEVRAAQEQTGFALLLDDDGNPVLENGRYLVQPDALTVTGQFWLPPTADPADVQFLLGVPAATAARITYVDIGVDGMFNFTFQATLIGEAPIAPVMLQVSGGQTARDTPFRSNPEPYVGEHQHDFCAGAAHLWSQNITLNP